MIFPRICVTLVTLLWLTLVWFLLYTNVQMSDIHAKQNTQAINISSINDSLVRLFGPDYIYRNQFFKLIDMYASFLHICTQRVRRFLKILIPENVVKLHSADDTAASFIKIEERTTNSKSWEKEEREKQQRDGRGERRTGESRKETRGKENGKKRRRGAKKIRVAKERKRTQAEVS